MASFLLLVAAIGLSVNWNRSIKTELAQQAASFVRKDLAIKEMRGAIEILNGVQFFAFSYVTLYAADGSHIITLPPVFDRKSQFSGLLITGKRAFLDLV